MTSEEIYAGLTEILRDTFLRDDIAATPTLQAADVDGWESLKQIEIIIAAEQKFGIKLSNADIENLETIGDLKDAIARRI